MKKFYLFGLLLSLLMGCADTGQDDISSEENVEDLGFDSFALRTQGEVYKDYNSKRLANLPYVLDDDCGSTVKVPQDYSTIQEAVDNVHDLGIVLVSDGVYDERIYVNKPGLRLVAIGDNVVIKRGIILLENANDVTVENFKVIMDPENPGISINHANRVTIKNNVIESSPSLRLTGLSISNSNGSKIQGNKIVGNLIGIMVSTGEYDGEGIGRPYINDFVMRDNIISDNSISGFAVAGLAIGGNLTGNTIENNRFENSTLYRTTARGGIIINFWPSSQTYEDKFEGNEIRNNIVIDVENGLRIDDYCSGNLIEGNEFLNNNQYGVRVDPDLTLSESNIFKNNTFSGNGICDVFDESNLNEYVDNTWDCTSGF